MSEQRRANLTPFGKSDKKSNKSYKKTFRLSFTLSDPNENSCPVFDYAAAVKSEERKVIKKHREEKEKKPNGLLDPFEDDDDDVKRLARQFEEKYGDKRKRCKSYAELGAGYDETDPFIDNTEAYDEALQEDEETPCGGYYINSGPLELKRVEVSDQSDADEVKKRRRKKALSVIEEEDGGEEEEDFGRENDKDEDGETKSIFDGEPSESKKAKLDEKEEIEKPPTPTYNGLEEPIKKKKKRVMDDSPTLGPIKTKKPRTVKALLEEKRIQEHPKTSEEPKKQIASETSITEAIESVVNAGNNDENSNSSNSSHSANTGTTSMSDESQDGKSSQENAPPLPDNLSTDVMTLVDQIKRTAAVTDNTRKTFCSEINNNLIKLEWKSKELTANSRNLLFAHLAHHLPCTKDTLMRRAKKLFLHKEESQIETVICKLKATIDATMPSLLEKYGKECQKVAEDKGLSATSGDGTVQGEGNQLISESAAAKLPKRKFPWTEETRGYLQSIVKFKHRCFRVLKPRKTEWEHYLRAFLIAKIKPLWPVGWMKISVLTKEINRTSASGKSKHSLSHSPTKADSSRLNVSTYSSPNSTNGSLYVSPNSDTPSQQIKSPVPGATPLAAKTGAEPINLLTKITTSLNSSPQKSHLSLNHQSGGNLEKPEVFSMDCLLKRTSDGTNCNDYSTTLSDLTKKDSVIMNGASLPLKNVNSSQKNDSSRSEKILDLSSCNSSVSGTPGVIQSVSGSERTTARQSDNVNCIGKPSNHSTSHFGKESVAGKEEPKEVDRRLTEETTTATDILSQIISESLRSPPQPPSSTPYTSMVKEEGKTGISQNTAHKGQELLFDVMQDLKELNHLSSGGARDNKHDGKNKSFMGTSWSYPVKSSERHKQSLFHNEFLKHLHSNQESASLPPPTPTSSPYSRHNVSSYDNSTYTNEISKSMYTTASHRNPQSLTNPSTKIAQMNQECMKSLQNTGISSGIPHRFMGQMDYSAEEPHMMGLAPGFQYGLTGWPYSGSESQSHQ